MFLAAGPTTYFHSTTQATMALKGASVPAFTQLPGKYRESLKGGLQVV